MAAKKNTARAPITGSGCTCGPKVLPPGYLCDWEDGAQRFCENPATVSLGVALRTVLCERHFREHAATCAAKDKVAPAPPAPPVNPYHELARFLQKGGTEAYDALMRALDRMKGDHQ